MIMEKNELKVRLSDLDDIYKELMSIAEELNDSYNILEKIYTNHSSYLKVGAAHTYWHSVFKAETEHIKKNYEAVMILASKIKMFRDATAQNEEDINTVLSKKFYKLGY